jgi:4-amino-4-deoxy-L-arabinose transferase-like glycosyltransferase
MVQRSNDGSTAEPDFGGVVIVLVVIAALRVFHLLFLYPIDLAPDEAQYWAWAQQPAFGYLSKPPLIAWAIAATTAVCGNAEGCVRLSSPLFQLGASLFVLGIGRRLFPGREGALIGAASAIAFATLPGVFLSSAIASTDAPLLFFWAGALYALIRAFEASSARWWALLGVFIGFGLLAKYAMAFFVLSAVLLIAIDREARSKLVSKGGAAALAIAALIVLPNILWNVANHFVTFAHTEANANLGGSLFHPNALLEFVGAQFGVFGPIFFAALLWIAIVRWGLLLRGPYRLLAVFAAPPLVLMIVLSVLSRANANWSAPTYIAGTVLVVTVLVAERRRRLITVSVALHSVVAVAAFAVVAWAVARPDALPSWADPLKRLRSWDSYGRAVTSVAFAVPHAGYVFDDRPELVEFLYYGERPAEAWKWNKRINDHFDLTRNVADAPPGPLVLVTESQDPAEILNTFQHSEPIGGVRQMLGRGRERVVKLFLVEGFKGYR